MLDHYALVYADYEGLNLLALGDKVFIKKEYDRIKNEIINLHKKFNYDRNEHQELPDEFYLSEYCQMDDIERLCIQGYEEDKIKCVCQKFDIGISEFLIGDNI